MDGHPFKSFHCIDKPPVIDRFPFLQLKYGFKTEPYLVDLHKPNSNSCITLLCSAVSVFFVVNTYKGAPE